MARATRKRAPSPGPVVEDEEPEQQEEDEIEVAQDDTDAFQFDEAITWKAGRPIQVADLLRRLQRLHEALSSLDQFDPHDMAGREPVLPKAQELVSTQLLGHKDKGVKAWTLACIVHMFRVLAPDAPFKPSQLREIFSLFISGVVPALASPSDPYQQQHLATLDSLSSVRSIVLLTDTPGGDKLILELFTNCFDVLSGNMKGASGEPVPKVVEFHMGNLLTILVDESEKLSPDIVDVILAQFLRADPTTLAQTGKRAPRELADISPAYNMARAVCTSCATQMKGAVGQYFSSVLIDTSEAIKTSTKYSGSRHRGRKRTHDESEDESDSGMPTPPAEDDFENAERAHRLLRELWRAASDVIENVIPQLEPELETENTELRTMAVQTVGDMVAGIGAAGPAPPQPLNPAAYPSHSLEASETSPETQNALHRPIAPHSFSSTFPECYRRFIARRLDKTTLVRSAWATAAARILLTSAGGIGLDADQETELRRALTDMLTDGDEKVRLAVVQALSTFDFESVVQKLGRSGGVTSQGSLLFTLAERIKDPKQAVRAAAAELLARIWGVASGAITEGSEHVSNLFGAIPSRILEAVYINNPQINALVNDVLYTSLLPTTYPPIKPSQASQRVVDSQATTEAGLDPDAIRVERILVLVRDLDQRARTVFFKLQQQQPKMGKYMEAYLKHAEALHDDANEQTETERKMMGKLVDALAKQTADPATCAEHLRLFAKHQHRRANQLIRFCFATDSDHRKIFKAMKEFRKKIEEAPTPLPSVLDSMESLLRGLSILVYNRSHVPSMMSIARSNEKELGATANDLLKEISSTMPEVFKVHVLEYCQALKKQVPTATSPNEPAAVHILKACSDFAQHSPQDMPRDRELYKAMSAFALHGTPPKAAKHAVTVIIASAEKKEMYISDILKQCTTDFEYGTQSFLSKLAALSQMSLMYQSELDQQTRDDITGIAASKILRSIRTPAQDEDPAWVEEPDDELAAKLWSLKILVNGIRGRTRSEMTDKVRSELAETAGPVYRILNTLIRDEGELSRTPDTIATPRHHKSHLRLAAAIQLVKLCCSRTLDTVLAPADFNRLMMVAQDPLSEVRTGFAKAIQKYLGQSKLANRFYAMVFMFAFEPNKAIQGSTTTWIKARAAASAKSNDTTMITAFARFLSLLAHHADFSPEPDELEDNVEYILFYLKNVATQDNLPLIHHLAQRVKSVQDGINPEKSENLYILSEMAEAIIRRYAEEKGWSLQLYSGKATLPRGPFDTLPSHRSAQKISEKRYLPEELADRLDDLVHASLKPAKKRKAERKADKPPAAKKVKTTNGTSAVKKAAVRKPARAVKTPKKKTETAVPSSERRKSARASNAKSYAEESDSEDNEGTEAYNDIDEDEDKENVESSTPPTSDPMPAPARKEKVPQRAARQLPSRGARKAEKDIMEIPSDSDELSDAPSDMEE